MNVVYMQTNDIRKLDIFARRMNEKPGRIDDVNDDDDAAIFHIYSRLFTFDVFIDIINTAWRPFIHSLFKKGPVCSTVKRR